VPSGRGFLVTFEGGEGAGKSTQVMLLSERLRKAGREVLTVREPGGTGTGEGIRGLLLNPEQKIEPVTELLLFLAARTELVAKVIRPAMEKGVIVLCDRFIDSTLAYQGYGRGLDKQVIRDLNAFATGGLEPDLTVFLDLEPQAGLRRKGGDDDTFTREDVEFHGRVRAGYHEIARQEPERWLIVAGDQDRGEIAGAIEMRSRRLFQEQRERAG